MTEIYRRTNINTPQIKPSIGPVARTAAFYVAAIVASLFFMIWILELRYADLSVPFKYEGDALYSSMTIKGVIDNGWYLYNNYLGAPEGQWMADFPSADNLHFYIIKIITLFSSDYALVLNLFYLATFPLTAVSALFVFRRFNISYPTAIFGSLLFTFLPYHIIRSESHLFLAAIYVIPLTSLLILRICSDSPPLLKPGESGKGERFNFLTPENIGFLIIAMLTGSAGIYYAFFACFFLMAAGIFAAWTRKSLRRALVGVFATLAVVIVLLVNLSPSLSYHNEYGENKDAAKRWAIQADIYGMTISQLILPITNHRVEFMADWKKHMYEDAEVFQLSSVFTNENDSSSLGLIGGAGLLVSIGGLLFMRRHATKKAGIDRQLVNTLGYLNILGIFLGTMGGFGFMFALIVSSNIRSYNRISVYIAFFSIMAMLIVLERLRVRFAGSAQRVLVFSAILAVAVILGILDQTSDVMVPPYRKTAASYRSDAAFVRKIEAAMPPQAQIFQLPYMPFPESPPVNNLQNYEQLIPYLHSSDLRWSFGMMRGRGDDLWIRVISQKPASQLLQDVVLKGYDGIYINRAGYADNAEELENELSATLKQKPLTNDKNTLLFFSLVDYSRNAKP